MEELLLTKIPVVATLTAVFFLLTAAQTLHALFLAARKSGRPVSAATVYEALLVVHLYLATATMLSAYANHGVLLLHLRVTALPLSALLWFNLALAVVGLTLAIRYRKPVMTWEIVLFAACSPPVIDAAGAFAPYLFIADAAFLTFRVSAGLILDIRRFRNSITRLSAIEAVDRLPEGLAMADKGGRVLYMNDAMRWCLMELGFATDLSDVSMLWENLCEIAERGAAPINDVLPEGVRIQIGEDNVRLFKRDTAEVNGKTYRRLAAIDVTEEERLNVTIARTNGLLEQANRELEESLAGVREVARNEAMLHMKARVHDTIGQRLSILHRYLEDGSSNPEALDQVTELVRSMMEDLARADDEQSPTELASIVHAFELVGVRIEQIGSLPKAPTVAEAFVTICREAATNAVKHGQAHNVRIAFEESDGSYTLRVTNDGLAGPSDFREGTGLPSMREAVGAVGGTCQVTATQPFTLEAVVPR